MSCRKKSSPLPVPKHYLRRHTAAAISPPNTLRPKVSETALGKSNANGGGGSMVDLQQSTHMPESVRVRNLSKNVVINRCYL